MTTTVNPLQTILSHLKGVQRHSGYYQAQCPGHDDKQASLSLSTGEDGKVLIKCHAGCSTEDILRAAGLSYSNLFPNNGNGKQPPKITQTYDYLDADGKLIHQTVRFSPKEFRQRRPDGNGGWIWNLKGIDPVPYRLPEIIKSQTVFIVEGEKDGDSLAAIGLTATTNPMGAGNGKWRSAYNKWFQGKKVTIIPDNDQPGQDHAEAVAQSLHGTAVAVKIINLPGLQPKGDVSDWLNQGGTKEELLRIVEAAPEYTPNQTAPTVQPEKSCFAGINLESISAARFIGTEPEPIDWLLKGSLGERHFGLVVADGGTGKGFVLLQLGISVSTGLPYLDGQFDVGKSGRVLLVFGEDDDQVVHNRLDGTLRSFDEEAEDEKFLENLRNNLHILNVCGQDARLVETVGGNLLPTQAYEDLLALAKGIENLKLLVLDPLSRFYAGDEKNSPDATFFCSLMERIAHETGATVLVSQHTNKASGTGKDSLTQHALRGSTGFTNAARWQLNIAKVDPAEWRRLGIPPEDVNRYLVAKVTKKNLGPPEDYFYLRHDTNGTLRIAHVDEGLNELDKEVTDTILAKIKEEKTLGGKRFTKRAFTRCFSKQWHNYGARKLEHLIDHAIAQRKLHLEPARNNQGIEVEYLDL